ncbi:MAG: hypothetical protein QME64_11190 [bacterium]|nr:hypothetical protein [bacterium]
MGFPSLKVDTLNNPHLAWEDDRDGNKEIYYQIWNGSIWTTKGTIANVSKSDIFSISPCLQLDRKDDPHIAWEEGGRIYYAYWNDTTWKIDGTISTAFFYSGQPTLALTTTNFPCIAWAASANAYQAQIAYQEWNGSSWISKGNAYITDSAGYSHRPSLGLDSANFPHIAYLINTSGNQEIYYQYWNGSVWTTAQNINISKKASYSEMPRLVIDRFNLSHILWGNENAATEILAYKYWTGSYWAIRGGSLFITPVPIRAGLGMHGLALDPYGYPHLVWSDYQDGNLEVCYLEWNGSTWTTKGATLNISKTTTESRNPGLALDKFSNLHIVWQEGGPEMEEIYYIQWDGSAWTTLGTTANISQTTGSSLAPVFALDHLENPHIVWVDSTPGNYDIFYRKWSGTEWLATENITSSSVPSYQPSIAIDSSGYLCIAWMEHLPPTLPGGSGEIYYQYWNGSVWTTLENINISQTLAPESYSQSPILGLDSAGYPHIAWGEVTFEGREQIYYREWNGSGWVTLGSLNISSTPEHARAAYLAIDKNGYIHIAWYDTSPGNKEIFYKFWNGTEWMFRGNINISNTSGGSEWPSLQLDKNGFPHIAWSDWTPGMFSIYYLAWLPTNIAPLFWQSLP